MASSVIHLAVAKEINKVLRFDEEKLLIGSIARDIAKCIGRKKYTTHFLPNTGTDIPDLNLFLEKYEDKLNDPFVLGYYIHLYTDYFWFKDFISEIIDSEDIITKLDGTKVKLNGGIASLYIYNDYTNLNI